MSTFTVAVPLALLSLVTIGEGWSSPLPGETISAGYRQFSAADDACGRSPVPARFVARPLHIAVGEQLTFDDFVVEAYDAAGRFIGPVPIEILTSDDLRLLVADKADPGGRWTAVAAGSHTFVVRHYCAGASGPTATVSVNVVSGKNE